MGYSLTKLERFLFFFSSEDIYVIEKFIQVKQIKKQKNIKYYFLTIGLAVLIFFICATISTMFFIYNIFDGYTKLLSLPIGLFFGLLISNIYLFLLYTITPTILDTVDKKKKKNAHLQNVKNTYENTSILSFSFFFRLVFIAFIALIIAQPLNVWLLIDMNPMHIAKKEIIQIERFKSESLVESYLINDSHYTKNEVILFKDMSQKIVYSIKHNSANISTIQTTNNIIKQKVETDENSIKKLLSFKNRLTQLNENFLKKSFNYQETAILISTINDFIEEISASDKHFLKQLNDINENKSIDNEVFEFYLQNTIPLIKEKIESHRQLKQLLDKNTLYTLKIRLLMVNNPLALLIAFLTIGVFCIPVFAKFFIRKKFNYYNFRASSEKESIIKLYEAHRKAYANLMNKKLRSSLDLSNEYLLEKLDPIKYINKSLYIKMKKDITDRIQNLNIEKFEYWQDAPFRTQRKSNIILPGQENLLSKLYN